MTLVYDGLKSLVHNIGAVELRYASDMTDGVIGVGLDAVQCAGSQRKAEKPLGLTKSTIVHQMKLAARCGLLGFKPVLPSFEVRSTKTTTDGKGNITSQTVVQGHETGPKFSDLPSSI